MKERLEHLMISARATQSECEQRGNFYAAGYYAAIAWEYEQALDRINWHELCA